MVRSMGAKMGMTPDRAASTFEVVNFAVLAVLLGWLLLKALPTAFRNRNTVIQKDLVDARTATEEAKARLGSVEARLAGLDAQIAGMKAQAEKDLVAEEQRIRASVEEERQRILQAADQEIAAATVVARRELQRLAVELAIGQASRKLEISAETDRLLVQNFARQLGADEGRGGSN
jgi:F-type H+-transporting ATPase subunit b